ncbi:hypothetical protein ILYODFUR_029505 [Ilyodon furcidens]|uniref:Uncharacterized protein n=1 Tax=Ilyodon furcidens TaxID=33524 RepID=A0ABV0T1N7_9TELE
MDEPPPHPDPVSDPVPEGFMDEPPPHPDPVSDPVPEGFLDEPPPQPNPVPVPVPKGSRAEPPTHSFQSFSVRGSWMDCLHFLLLLLVLSWRASRTNCLHPWLQFRRSSWRTCLHFLFLSLRSARMHPLCMLGLGGSAADLRGLTEGPSGLCTDHLGSSGFRTAPLSSTVGSPGPAAGCQFIGSYIASLLIAGSAGDSHRAGRLNSCPPSEAPSAHPGWVLLFLVLAVLPRPPPPTLGGCLFYFCFVGIWDPPLKGWAMSYLLVF